jgi:hypothetical protein
LHVGVDVEGLIESHGEIAGAAIAHGIMAIDKIVIELYIL